MYKRMVMEISKPLQDEVKTMQGQLGMAIRDHHACLLGLRSDPSDTKLAYRLAEIQQYIVKISRWQKDVLKRMRAEIESYKCTLKLGSKFWVAPIRGLYNSYLPNTGKRAYGFEIVVGKGPAIVNGYRRSSVSEAAHLKDHYEDNVKNESDRNSNKSNEGNRSSSAEPMSAEEDTIEISATQKSDESNDPETEVTETLDQESFLKNLGLLTNERHAELISRKKERKRRSTANPNYVWDIQEKRRKKEEKALYLKTINPVQTRQAKAKLSENSSSVTASNNNKTSAQNSKTAASKSKQMPHTNNSAKPTILRGNALESVLLKDGLDLEKAFAERRKFTVPSPRLPPLPSGITIERIIDTPVCVICRNPGSLRACETCSGNFHLSCHHVLPASSWNCPKCVPSNGKKRKNLISLLVNRRDKNSDPVIIAPKITRRASDSLEVTKMPQLTHAFKSRDLDLATEFVKIPSSTTVIPMTQSKNVPLAYTESILTRKRKDVSSRSILIQHLRMPVKLENEPQEEAKKEKDRYVMVYGREKVVDTNPRSPNSPPDTSPSSFDYNKWIAQPAQVKIGSSISILKPKSQESIDSDLLSQDNLPATAPASPELIELDSPNRQEKSIENPNVEVILLS